MCGDAFTFPASRYDVTLRRAPLRQKEVWSFAKGNSCSFGVEPSNNIKI